MKGNLAWQRLFLNLDCEDPEDRGKRRNKTPPKKRREGEQHSATKEPRKRKLEKAVESCKPADFGTAVKHECKLMVPSKKEDTSAEVRDADAQLQLVEGNEFLTIDRPSIQRRAHSRSCLKKVVNPKMARFNLLKSHLAACGVTWGEFQKEHTRRAFCSTSQRLMHFVGRCAQDKPDKENLALCAWRLSDSPEQVGSRSFVGNQVHCVRTIVGLPRL